MSWDWVKWDDDSYVSSCGCSISIHSNHDFQKEPEYVFGISGSDGGWIVGARTFPSEEEARAAMMEFIGRCGPLNITIFNDGFAK